MRRMAVAAKAVFPAVGSPLLILASNDKSRIFFAFSVFSNKAKTYICFKQAVVTLFHEK
jgi:hypothetical protein